MQFNSLLLLVFAATTIVASALHVDISIHDSTTPQGVSQTPLVTGAILDFPFTLLAYSETPSPDADSLPLGVSKLSYSSKLTLGESTVFTMAPNPNGDPNTAILLTQDTSPDTGTQLAVSVGLERIIQVTVALLPPDMQPFGVISIQEDYGNGDKWYIQIESPQEGGFGSYQFAAENPVFFMNTNTLYLEVVPA